MRRASFDNTKKGGGNAVTPIQSGQGWLTQVILRNTCTKGKLPGRQDVMNEMMRNVYNEMVNRIRNTVDW